MTDTASSEVVTPLLVAHMVARTGDDRLPGYYDPIEQVWVVETSNGVRPIVQVQADLAEIKTITEVKQERLDAELLTVPELSTKTAVARESDDQRLSAASLVELVTTTKISSERIDR